MAEPLLATENLVKRFAGVAATDDLSLAIAEGELHAVIGPNGAGKTTLVAQLAGEIAPSAGRIRLRRCAASSARWTTSRWRSRPIADTASASGAPRAETAPCASRRAPFSPKSALRGAKIFRPAAWRMVSST